MAHHFNGAQFRFREELRYAEDYVSCLDWFPKYKSYALLPEPLYYYVVNPDSIMNAYNPRRIQQLLMLFDIREEFMKKECFQSQADKYVSANLLLKLVFDQLENLAGLSSLKISQKLQKLKELCGDTRMIEASGRLVKGSMDDWGRLGRWSIHAIHQRSHVWLLFLLFLQKWMKK